MQFLKAKQRVRLGVTKARVGGRLEDRSVTIEFGLQIDPEVAKALPKNIQDEYRGMRSAGTGVGSVEFDSSVDSQNIKIWRLPTERGEEDFRMKNVDLKSMALERAPSKDVFLFFKVSHPMSKSVWRWLWYAFQREVFAEFEECQTEMDIKETPGPAN